MMKCSLGRKGFILYFQVKNLLLRKLRTGTQVGNEIDTVGEWFLLA